MQEEQKQDQYDEHEEQEEQRPGCTCVMSSTPLLPATRPEFFSRSDWRILVRAWKPEGVFFTLLY